MQTLVAIFAGGCFWCMEPAFDAAPGVLETTSGYTGGFVDNPTYEQVSSGTTGHVEALRVTYDPSKITYQQLLDIYWKNVDPTDAGGQFCDRGEQYRSVIFYINDEQKRLAEESRAQLPFPALTQILPAKTFYPAEEYHQDYYLKHPYKYKFYRYNCGRDKRLKQLWGS